MMLLPPRPGVCPICAHDHAPDQPHNAQSLYYQYRFFGVRGRWPTWADAIAHCAPSVQDQWRTILQEKGYWTEPEEGEPIADPPAESICQAIGDVNSRGFGPDANGMGHTKVIASANERWCSECEDNTPHRLCESTQRWDFFKCEHCDATSAELRRVMPSGEASG